MSKSLQMDIATTLLEYGAQTNAESKAGFTPLHLSAQEGHTDMSTLLIEHEADPNFKAKNGLTPLHLCSQEDRVNVAAILVKNNAEIDTQTKVSSLEKWIAILNHHRCSNYVLITIFTLQSGYTPLHVACHFGQMNMVRFLLGHKTDVTAVTNHGYTPLHQAAQQGHPMIVSLLLDSGASPNALTNVSCEQLRLLSHFFLSPHFHFIIAIDILDSYVNGFFFELIVFSLPYVPPIGGAYSKDKHRCRLLKNWAT